VAGSTPTALTISQDGQFLYVANRGGTVSTHPIASGSGTLNPLMQLLGNPFRAGTNPSAIAVSGPTLWRVVRTVRLRRRSTGQAISQALGCSGCLIGQFVRERLHRSLPTVRRLTAAKAPHTLYASSKRRHRARHRFVKPHVTKSQLGIRHQPTVVDFGAAFRLHAITGPIPPHSAVDANGLWLG